MAAVCLTPLEQVLQDRFRQMAGGPPEWAWPYPAPIPLAGRNYVPGRGLLVYASAENLAWMDRDKQHQKPRRESFGADVVAVRYRHQYENPQLQVERFFPDVGMAPVSNGGLLCAAYFVLDEIEASVPSSPRALLDLIAVANWCKFVMLSNVDYVRDREKLRKSLPYVTNELEVLRPHLVIMPKTILGDPDNDIYEAMRGASPETTFVGVMQFNAMVVNCHLQRFDDAAAELGSRYASTPLATWMSKLRRVNRDHAWRFLAHVAEQLREARRLPA